MTKEFFNEPEDRSLVKATIVVKYFMAWSRIMAKRAERIGYWDFFAGPGRYGTGQKSTPLLILESAVADATLRDRLVTLFNDANPSAVDSLEQEIAGIPDIDSLAHKPRLINAVVDDQVAERFASIRTIPALSFIDPWGYKGLSLRLIRAVIKDWGCEAIFFFNYNRINMGVNNGIVEPHMQALFGPERLACLRKQLQDADPERRESILRRQLGEALTDMGAPYLIPFRFSRESGRASHYICFVSKHPLGYSIMKDIMARESVVDDDGVPMFEYLPPHGGRQLPFDDERPLRALPNDLLSHFAGHTVSVKDIIEEHHPRTPFIGKNYKKVLRQLEAEGRVRCTPTADERPRGKTTMADRVAVSFPDG